MQEQLREARIRGWCYSGVVPLEDDDWGQFDSVNERRAFEALRFAFDVINLSVKPGTVDWVDSQFVKHKYSPDARTSLASGDAVLIEIKPKGILSRDKVLTAKYEDIGRFLQEEGRMRFGLLEWQWDSVFARNVSRLSRYWNVEPSTHALDAFRAIDRYEATLDQVFERVEREHWPAVWAALGQQHLVTDLHAAPLSRQTRLSEPGVVYEPVVVASLVTRWWA